MAHVADSAAVTRRRFLIRTGWLAAGVTVLTACGPVRSIMPALPALDDPELEDGLAWVQALPDGRIRFFCPRMEMGQGALLGLSQVVAEELNVGQAEIICVLADTAQTPPFKMTVGSESIANFFEPVSYGAARLREALRGLAAKKAGRPQDQVRDGRGGFVLPDGTELGYGALVPADAQILPIADQPTDGRVPRRYAAERSGKYRAIGQGWRDPALEAIVTGKTVYSRDVSLPGMLYGEVLRPPAFGARLQSVDSAAAKAMAGVVAVVVDRGENFVGVVTDDPFTLSAAIERIDAKWQAPHGFDQARMDSILDVARARARGDFEHELAADGDIEAGRRTAQHQVSARYDTSFAAHAPMEPRAAVAWVKRDKVEIWCGSQDPFFVQRRAAKALGRAPGDVVVHPLRMGGSFGGRVLCQASEEAVRLSAAVSRPVRVQWTREAELQNGYFQPAFSHRIDAGVTADGRISHWAHDFVSSPILTGLFAGSIAWVIDRVVADAGTARGGKSQYLVPNQHIRYSDVRTGVPTGNWRGLGAAPNSFAIESMMDELAHTAGADPLEFRLRNLPATSHRLAGVLRRVAEISDWRQRSRRTAGSSNIGYGLACAVYKDLTAVAVVMEVQVDHAAKALRASRAWCAQDCGLVVNPRQVESAVMGNIVWGCNMALKERVTIEAGTVVERNFDSYEILRHDECPDMKIALVEPADAQPVGVGESAFPPVAAAIANALFAATGRRVRRVPTSYDRIFADG